MKATKIYNEKGNDFKYILLQMIESELDKIVNQKYNGGKDTVALERKAI